MYAETEELKMRKRECEMAGFCLVVGLMAMPLLAGQAAAKGCSQEEPFGAGAGAVG